MVKRFRMIAGPNGSGKTTLVERLRNDYSVNFYTFVNADDIFAQVLRTGAYSPKFPVSRDELVRYAEMSTYADNVKDLFRGDKVRVVCSIDMLKVDMMFRQIRLSHGIRVQ